MSAVGTARQPHLARIRLAVMACALVCAAAQVQAQTEAGADPVQATSSKDPLEGFNRAVYSFNDAIDRAALKPLAQGYRDVVPAPVRNGVDNFFGNLGDVWSTVNLLLQGKFQATLEMTMRVASNTVFGMGGLLDPATEMGLERHSEDFGQTLGRWGVPPGAFLMLPLLGPSTVRDTVALPLDRSAGPTALVHSSNDVVGVVVLQTVSGRAGLLGASNLLDDIAFDKYSFLRDAYLARRRNQVYDGNPPEEDDEPPSDMPR
jgi:phospholipid-binding lipoprotein MlaA